MPKPKSHRKGGKSGKSLRERIFRPRRKSKKDEIEERRALEKKFLRSSTKKGRAHDIEMAHHYAHAHEPENVEKGVNQKNKLKEIEEKRQEAAREMAKRIAEMDKETERRLHDLESIKAVRALEQKRVELIDEEMELEVMEQKVKRTMRDNTLKKKRLKWIKKREKVIKKELKRVKKDVSKLSKKLKKERDKIGRNPSKRDKLRRLPQKFKKSA
jgi:hypothetical protein